MKIGWFSPISPALSEIAAHTDRLKVDLCDTFDMQFWADGIEEGKCPSFGRPIRHCHQTDLNSAEVNIYQLGNHAPAHAEIYFASLRRPGIVVLHDIYFRHFFAGLCLQMAANPEAFIELFRSQYGERGTRAAKHYLRKAGEHIDMELRCWEAAAIGATSIVVHSHSAKREIEKMGVTSHYAPLPFNSSQICIPRSASKSVVRLVMCGFMGFNRRVRQVLDALAQFQDKKHFHLDIYGQVPASLGVGEHIAKLGLQDSVTIHGFVSEKCLTEALNNADMAINLRNPSMGEASASQLRFWDHALPTMVSNTGWYGEQPKETVFFVRLYHEIDDIQSHLQGYLESPERYRQCGQAGKEHLATNHKPAAYVSAIERLIHRARDEEKKLEIYSATDRVAALLSSWNVQSACVPAAAYAATVMRVFNSDNSSAYRERPQVRE